MLRKISRRFLFLLSVVIATMWSLPAIAQSGAEYDKSKLYTHNNVIGASVSYQTGYGFMYHRRITDDIRFKTVLFFYLSDRNNSTESEFNGAIEAQYDMLRSAFNNAGIRFYVLASARYYQGTTVSTQTIILGGQVINNETLNDEFLNSYGVGIGAELLVADRIIANVDACYGYRGERRFPAANYPDHPYRDITPSLGIGLGLMF